MIPFFLALFSQFIHLGSGNVALQSFILGLTLALITVVRVGGLAIFVGYARSILTRSESFVRGMQRLAAIAFVGLAVRLVLADE